MTGSSQPGHAAQGRFGNLIALPLQKQPREQGTACFSMSSSLPIPTSGRSWRRCGRSAAREAEAIVRDAEGKGRVVGRASCPGR